MSSFDINALPGFDAQIAHVGWGAFLVLAFALWLPAALAVALALLVSFGKEAFEATGIAFWEPRQRWSDSFIDFGFFAVGAGLSVILLVLHII
jgi:hypothetical protein